MRKGTMEDMEHEPDYDWVDDHDLSLEETLRRFHSLEAAQVVTTPPP
jgi:hypothetical protein